MFRLVGRNECQDNNSTLQSNEHWDNFATEPCQDVQSDNESLST